MGSSNVTINAAGGGGRGNGVNGGTRGNTGNVVLSGFTSTYTYTTAVNGGSRSTNLTLTSVNGGYIFDPLSTITTNFFINNLSDSGFNIGGIPTTTSRGQDSGNAPVINAQNGANGYIRVYYFYN